MKDERTKRPTRVAFYARVGHKEQAPKQVAIYARVALEDYREPSPLRMQEESLKAIIHKHADWGCVGVYADDGWSGNNAARPEFLRLLADCDAGKIDLIVVKSVCRIARDPIILITTLQRLRRLGIEVFFAEEGSYASEYPRPWWVASAQSAAH